MILSPLRRIAADSNVLLSAVIGKAALKVFVESQLTILTTQFNIEEVKEYLPQLSSKYSLHLPTLWLQLRMLPLMIHKESYYKNELPRAIKYLKNRDEDDVHLAALALKEHIPIWSNDRDLLILPLEVYSTHKLLNKLNL